MLKVYLKKLKGEPLEVLDELEAAYRALHTAAARENDLFHFLKAELALATLNSCRWALRQPQCYPDGPYFLLAEEHDSAQALFTERCAYVFNCPIG